MQDVFPDIDALTPNSSRHYRFRRRWTALVVVVATCAFVVPLFLGLDRLDLDNDEAIYAYAVQRMLETGDWLTPRSIPTDFAFFEKPPLKFWVVAGGMVLGLIPNDEFGMRVVDALFGAIAFGYIMAFGWRVGGPLCGAVALFVTFMFEPLVFEHGLRSNNMESALLLSFCGGLWHVVRWSETEDVRHRRLHAFAFAAFFVLGFMTKFVAVVFLPLICIGLVVPWPQRRGAAQLASRWRDWLWPSAAVVLAIAPWFLYQWHEIGTAFWRGIFGHHVYLRFTASLDPTHLKPWPFYFSELARQFGVTNTLLVVLAGVVLTSLRAVQGVATARLLLAWWLLPLLLISFGTSKLLHYAYPFVPPLAIGAGWAVVTFLRALHRHLGAALATPWIRGRLQPYMAARPVLRVGCLVVSGLAVGVALWTLLSGGRMMLIVGDTQLFRNSSVARPLIVSALLLVAAGYGRVALRGAVVCAFLLLVPLHAYGPTVQRVFATHYPLRAAQQCMLEQQAAGRTASTGVYLTDPALVSHPPSYYFRQVGRWRTGPDSWLEELERSIWATQTPVLLSDSQWNIVRARPLGQVGRSSKDFAEELRAVRVQPNVLLLLPGAYSVCEERIVSAGAAPYAMIPLGH